MSSPNQKIILTHKPNKYDDFLLVGTDEWISAANLDGDSKSVLITYLYLASNKDNYRKEFSPQDMVNLFGKSTRTWERALKTLMDQRYIIYVEGDPKNVFHFYTTPQIETNVEYSIKEYMKIDEKQQEQIYNEIIKIDWDKMSEEQKRIHDFYIEFIMED